MGATVLVSGEAGIGKSSLLQAFADRAGATARVLAGACEDLLTPRPLGPFRDMARDAGGLAGLAGDDRDAFLDALLAEMSFTQRPARGDRRGRPLGRRRLARHHPLPGQADRPAGGAAGGQLPRRGAGRRPPVRPHGRRPGRAVGAPDRAGGAVRRGRGRAGHRRRARPRPGGGGGRRQPLLPDRGPCRPRGRRPAVGAPRRAGPVLVAAGVVPVVAGAPGRRPQRGRALAGAVPGRGPGGPGAGRAAGDAGRRPGAGPLPARAGQAGRRAVAAVDPADGPPPAGAGRAGRRRGRALAAGPPRRRRRRRAGGGPQRGRGGLGRGRVLGPPGGGRLRPPRPGARGPLRPPGGGPAARAGRPGPVRPQPVRGGGRARRPGGRALGRQRVGAPGAGRGAGRLGPHEHAHGRPRRRRAKACGPSASWRRSVPAGPWRSATAPSAPRTPSRRGSTRPSAGPSGRWTWPSGSAAPRSSPTPSATAAWPGRRWATRPAWPTWNGPWRRPTGSATATT